MRLIMITNDVEIAAHSQDCGVDIIMVDLEVAGKFQRQGHLDAVLSGHTLADIPPVRSVLTSSLLLVRVNPPHSRGDKEIDDVIRSGADIVMLPMFSTPDQVRRFVDSIGGRASVNLLLETPAALARVDEILAVPGIHQVHIGLNDLHLGMGLDFMFELLSGGIVEYLANRCHHAGVQFGFGGIGRVASAQQLDPGLILAEHRRLGSSMVILSRCFHGRARIHRDLRSKADFGVAVDKLRYEWESLRSATDTELLNSRDELARQVANAVGAAAAGVTSEKDGTRMFVQPRPSGGS